MKKKMWVIIASAFAVIASVVIVVFALPRGNEVTEDEAYSSVTTRGIFGTQSLQSNGISPQAVVTFADFASGKEEVFCSKPQCLHRDNSCFAFDLATNIRAENFAIMGDNLYYTVMGYDPESDKPNTVEVYEASFDGGRNRRIALFAREENLSIQPFGVRLKDGYYIIHMEAVGGDAISVSDAFMKNATHFFGVVNLQTGEVWETPGKTGYGVSQEFITLQNGKLIYRCESSSTPVDTSPFATLLNAALSGGGSPEEWAEYDAFLAEHFRWTVYSANLEAKSEVVWNEEFSERKPTEDGVIISFRIAGDYVAVNRYKAEEPDVFTLYDPETAEPIRTLTFPEGYAYLQSAGEYLLIIKPDRSDNMLYRLSDGETVSVSELGRSNSVSIHPKYSISPYRSIGNILIVEESDPSTGSWRQDIIRWITVEDLFNNGMSNLHTIICLSNIN